MSDVLVPKPMSDDLIKVRKKCAISWVIDNIVKLFPFCQQSEEWDWGSLIML